MTMATTRQPSVFNIIGIKASRLDFAMLTAVSGTRIATVGVDIRGDSTPVRVTITGDLQDAKALELRFAELIIQWHSETDQLSSPSQIAAHPAYLEMIGYGEWAIRPILEDLRDNGGEWFRALRAILKDQTFSPASQADLNDSRRVVEAWLRWGKAKGYLD